MTPKATSGTNFGSDDLLIHAEGSHIMGMAAIPDTITTIEELLALPEDHRRHELLDGVYVVTPTPRPLHQVTAMELAKALSPAFDGHAEYQLFGLPGDIQLGPRTLVEPDLFVVGTPRGPSDTELEGSWRTGARCRNPLPVHCSPRPRREAPDLPESSCGAVLDCRSRRPARRALATR